MHIAAMFKLPGWGLAGPLLVPVAMSAGLLFFAFTFTPSPERASGAGVAVEGGASAPVRRMAGPYRAEAIRVVDGDTFEARLRIWFNQDVTVSIRLDGVDAPEIRGRCERESRLAVEARDALAAILAAGEVFVRDLHTDKYNGRAVGRATVVDRGGAFSDDVGALLEAGGYARPYDGRARSPWCGPQPPLLAGAARPR